MGGAGPDGWFPSSERRARPSGPPAAQGAIDTFDAFGYLALLRRIRTEQNNPVYAPDFGWVLEEPIAASIAIEPDVRLVITEGNYILSAT
jgi:pantothenate kinase